MAKSGGWAMIPLAAMSVVTLMLVIVYMITLRRGAIASASFMNTADVLLKKRDYHGLLAIANRHGEMAARIVQRTLDFATRNPKASYSTIREIAQTEGSTLAASLQYRIVYLADIAMLSPMVGLLGTVLGIITSFGTISREAPVQTRKDAARRRHFRGAGFHGHRADHRHCRDGILLAVPGKSAGPHLRP